MSEAPEAQATASVSAGELLREARERAGVHIGALAVGLKIPVKKIEALEADRLDLLPDAVFARALASSIARTLKIDSTPILAALPQGVQPGLAVMGGSIERMALGAGSQPAMRNLLNVVRKPAVLIGAVLVLGALALVFVPMSETGPRSQTSSEVKTTRSLPSAGSESSVPMGSNLPSAGLTQLNAGVPAQSGAEAGTSSAPQNAQPTSSMIAASSALAAATNGGKTLDGAGVIGSGAEVQVTPGNTGLVQLIASGITWVEVTDSAGVVQLRKTLAAGEKVSAGGALPLKVVVGRVNATQVQVRGKPFDMTPFGKDNVARFEVR